MLVNRRRLNSQQELAGGFTRMLDEPSLDEVILLPLDQRGQLHWELKQPLLLLLLPLGSSIDCRNLCGTLHDDGCPFQTYGFSSIAPSPPMP